MPPRSGRVESLKVWLPQLFEVDVELVTALVEFFAAADSAGAAEIARLAEPVIRHETTDVKVLYPAGLLVGSAARTK